MIDAKNMASTIIKMSREKGIYLDHLKLQKLLYFVSLEWVNNFGEYPYIQNTEMWKLGPVINDVYSDYRSFGSSQIESPATTFQILQNGEFLLGETVHCDLDINQEYLVSQVLDEYGRKDSFDLVNITHEHGPWKRNEKDIIQRKTIEYTLEDYKEILSEIEGVGGFWMF